MSRTKAIWLCLYLIFSYVMIIDCAPRSRELDDDDDEDTVNEIIPTFINQSLDYNAVVGHFKDFFMYLPVMFTTLKETMSGFPKLAEGVKILTSGMTPAGTISSEEHCKCKSTTITTMRSNDID
ncbi:uncharacterized protein LOC142234398 [Haematobia irritans]|uniref:uncharacterized protein LOC142234398 n=1 Tax=Haematobia irritans TaxID=7368 RepID=UPI003F4FA01E